ncbi:MAG: ABC transporter permease subunit [Candidatus Hydrogenedentes bacterium]|nr:ABC transporter permease subunit [Candidatus Hydrogenedentota bacterium]
MRILTVALNTYREAVRDKILYVLLFFAGATILFSKALGYISVGEDMKIITDISLAAISVFGALIAIFVGTNLVYKEIDKRTIYTILSRPLWRFEFILGKFAGLSLLIATVTVVMGVGAGAYILLLGGTVNVMFAEALLLIFWKLVLLTALSVLLSTLTSPILGAIVVLTAYFAGHATGILIDLPGQFDETFAKELVTILYYAVPNLSNFDIWREYANGVAVPHSYVAWTILYGTVYTGMLLFLACIAFHEKDV